MNDLVETMAASERSIEASAKHAFTDKGDTSILIYGGGALTSRPFRMDEPRGYLVELTFERRDGFRRQAHIQSRRFLTAKGCLEQSTAWIDGLLADE